MAEEGFAPVIKAIRKWDKEVRNELRKELRAATDLIAIGARARADEVSTRIGKTIKRRTRIQSRKVEVEIKAGSPDVPTAGLFELGNKDGRSRGKFRHPVFGDRENWVDQAMHPYLAPEVKAKEAAVTERIERAVDKANEIFRL